MTFEQQQRLDGIRKLLETWRPTVVENNEAFHARQDLVFVLDRLDETHEQLKEALPTLRLFARNCEACGGYGAIINTVAGTDNQVEEPCLHCAPLDKLIEQADPPKPPAPIQVAAATAKEWDDDLPF